jgi:hypothetical protein
VAFANAGTQLSEMSQRMISRPLHSQLTPPPPSSGSCLYTSTPACSNLLLVHWLTGAVAQHLPTHTRNTQTHTPARPAARTHACTDSHQYLLSTS